ncbi:MAG: hypothetical protein Q8R36_05610 [bacterium]|nr:hypothetical protein [bacterium]
MRKSAIFIGLILGSVALAACAQTSVNDKKEVAAHEHRDHGAHHGSKDGGHAGHEHKGQDTHNHAAHMCETVLPRNEVDIPDLKTDRFEVVQIIHKNVTTDRGEETFVYAFYKEKGVNPSIVVATTTTKPFPSFTSIVWDTGDKKRRTILESRTEGICETSLYGSDGKPYDLNGYMKKISDWGKK